MVSYPLFFCYVCLSLRGHSQYIFPVMIRYVTQNKTYHGPV